MLLFFFFKQKTAYEMRISDWSSDVCSSDLPGQIKLVRLWRAPVQLSDGGPLWVGTTQILHYAEPFGLFGLWVPGPDTGVAQDDVRAAMADFAMEQAPHPHTGGAALRLRIPARPAAPDNLPHNLTRSPRRASAARTNPPPD